MEAWKSTRALDAGCWPGSDHSDDLGIPTRQHQTDLGRHAAHPNGAVLTYFPYDGN